MEDSNESPHSETENNTSRQDVPELPLLRNCLFPEQFSDVPFRFRYQPPEDHDVTTGSELVSTNTTEGQYMNENQVGSKDVSTGSPDVTENSEVSMISEASQLPQVSRMSEASQTDDDSLLSRDLQISNSSELEIPTSRPLDHMSSIGNDNVSITTINTSVNASITSINSGISSPGLPSIASHGQGQSHSNQRSLEPATSTTMSSETSHRGRTASPKQMMEPRGMQDNSAGVLLDSTMRDTVVRDTNVRVMHDAAVMHDSSQMRDVMPEHHSVMQDASSHSPLDGTVSIDSPAPSPSLDDIGSSRLDRHTPDMSLSSSISTNLNSSVSSSPLTPLNQECSRIPSPEVPTPVSSTSFLNDDSGIDDNSHSSASKCTLLESSCHEETMNTRGNEEALHIPYRTLDYGLMSMYPAAPYTQTYPVEHTFSQRLAYPPREMRPDHMFPATHTMMETHDDSGIDVSRSTTYYNFQPMTPNSNLANWLARTNQIPVTPPIQQTRSQQRQEAPMITTSQRSAQVGDVCTDVVCEKPPDTYISLISQAILNSPEQRLILSDIYKYIRNTYPYYKTADDTWKNAIRHNLSVNECFVKNGRAPNGRGYYWSIHPACVRSFMEGDFRRREARRLARDANKTREGKMSKQAQVHVSEALSSTPRRGRSMTLAKVMGLPPPSPMMPASPALIPITCGPSFFPSHPATPVTSSPIPPPPPLSYPHPYLSAYYSPQPSYSLPYPPLPSPIANPQGSFPHMSAHVNPSSFSLSIPTIYGNLAPSSQSNLPKNDY